MATLREKIEALNTYLTGTSGLNITVRKGEPDFQHPSLTTPLAAILYGGNSGGAGDIRKRVGASATATVVTLNIYASDEVNLFELAQTLDGLRVKKITLSAGSDHQAVRLLVGPDERIPADAEDPKELRHAITCPLVLAYE